MFALSSSAIRGHVRNRYGYQGQERENTFALNLNEFEARHGVYPAISGNPQTGRWMVPDPAQQFPLSYVGMGNQWVSGVDPDGRAVVALGVKIVSALVGAIANVAKNSEEIKLSRNFGTSVIRGLGYAIAGGAGAFVGTIWGGGSFAGGLHGALLGGGATAKWADMTYRTTDDDWQYIGRGASASLMGKSFGKAFDKGYTFSEKFALENEPKVFKGSKFNKFITDISEKSLEKGLGNLSNKYGKYGADGIINYGENFYNTAFWSGILSGGTNYFLSGFLPSLIPDKTPTEFKVLLNASAYGFGSYSADLVKNQSMYINLNEKYRKSFDSNKISIRFWSALLGAGYFSTLIHGFDN